MKDQFVTKKELTLRYFPDSDPRVAVNNLVRSHRFWKNS